MSTDMAKIYNSHNFISLEMVTLLRGGFLPVVPLNFSSIFILKTVSKCPEMLYTLEYSKKP